MTTPDDKTEREHCERLCVDLDWSEDESVIQNLMRTRKAARAEGYAAGLKDGRNGG